MTATAIHTSDGAEMGGYLSVPESGEGPGVVVLMEIFGVGSYVKRATERLANSATSPSPPTCTGGSRPGSSSSTTRTA